MLVISNSSTETRRIFSSVVAVDKGAILKIEFFVTTINSNFKDTIFANSKFIQDQKGHKPITKVQALATLAKDTPYYGCWKSVVKESLSSDL